MIDPLEIKEAMERNTLFRNPPPTRAWVKRQIYWGNWVILGETFGFKPVFLATPSNRLIIDWRCVPPRMTAILHGTGTASVTGIPATAAGRVKPQPSKRMVTFSRQQGVCHYCHKTIDYRHWTVDHRTPLSRGGAKGYQNIIGCCSTCNGAKACLTEAEFRATDYPPLRGLKDINRTSHLKAAVKKVHLPMCKPNSR